MAAAGNVDWDMAYVLYEVLPDRIDQVRGFDLANMTITKGQTGWVRRRCQEWQDADSWPF